jgi:hypothetical protein
MFGGTSSVVELILRGKDEASGAFEAVSGKVGGLASVLGAGVVAGTAALGAALAGASVAALNLSNDIDVATDNVVARLGASGDAAGQFESVIKGVFANNFGESFEDIGQAVVVVNQNLGDLPVGELQSATEAAFSLRDAFGVEVNESVNAAQALMDEFGLSSTEAFDLIASGMQNGLNSSGDFLDSIGEYSNVFADAGFEADAMYSIMETGAASGVLGTDKVSDAIKEMTVRLAEGGDDVSNAFDAIGMDFEQISGSVAAGDEAWSDYFPNIIDGLNSIEDPLQRQRAQVAIFGTMAEDLGVSFTEGLSAGETALESMGGATASLEQQYDNWPAMWQGIKRNALLALEPLGDSLLGLAQGATPALMAAFDAMVPALTAVAQWLGTNIPAAIAVLQTFWTGQLQPFIANAGALLQSTLGPGLEQIRIALGEAVPLAMNIAATYWNDYLQPAFTALGEIIADPILPLLGDLFMWIGEQLPSAIAFAQTAWQTVLQPAMQMVGEFISGTLIPLIGDLFEWVGTNLPEAVQAAQSNFSSAWDAISGAVDSAWSTISPIFDSIRGFADWLSSHVFNFSINLPDLPGWAIPGSPIPLHTAWRDFGQYMQSADFTPQMTAPDSGVSPAGAAGGMAMGNQTTYLTVNVNDQKTADMVLKLIKELRNSKVIE